MGCFVRGGKNCTGCFVRGDKTAWDVLSVVANRCRMFCPGCIKMARDVLSRDVLSYIHKCEFSVYTVRIFMKCTHVCAAQTTY